MKKQKVQALLVLAGVILIRGFASGGITMTASLFLSPVSQELEVGIGTLSIYFSIMSLVAVAWLPYAGKLLNRFSVRVLVPAAAVLEALSFAGFGLLHHVAGWYLLAIPQAMGTAILTSLLGPILINRWFPKNTGLIMGIQMAFVWLFAAVLQPVVSRVIEADGWRSAYFFAGIVTFVVVVAAGLLLLRDRPDAAGIADGIAGKAAGEAAAESVEVSVGEIAGEAAVGIAGETVGEAAGMENPAKTAAIEIEKEGGIEISEKEATHSASFVLLLIFMFSMTGAGVFTQHIPTYGGLLGYPLSQAGFAMSLSSVGSAIGSVAIGLISDRVGGLKTCYGIICLWILAVVGFIISGTGFYAFAASAFLHGVASSSIAVIAPILTLSFYGKKDYEKIFAKVSMGAPLASVLLVPAYGFIYDAAGSYFAVLVLLIAMLCVAGLAIMFGWKKRCTAAGCPAWRG